MTGEGWETYDLKQMENGSDFRKKTFPVTIQSPGAERLRKTIQAKLADFMGDHSDDVLAEYVVVLIAHGKHHQQTADDLDAFLGENTYPFVDWLWDHLTANKHLYVSKSAEDSRKEASNIAKLETDDDGVQERSKASQKLAAENDEAMSKPLGSSLVKEITENVAEGEQERQSSSKQNFAEKSTVISITQGANDVTNERVHVGERVEEDGFKEEDNQGWSLRNKPYEEKREKLSDRREGERVQRDEGEGRYHVSKQGPDTFRSRNSGEERRRDRDNSHRRQTIEKSSPTENIPREEDRNRNRKNDWPERLYRPPALGDRYHRKEFRSRNRGDDRRILKSSDRPADRGAQNTRVRGKVTSNARHPLDTLVDDDKSVEEERMEVEAPSQFSDQERLEEAGQEKPESLYDRRNGSQSRRWGALDKGNRQSGGKRARADEGVNARTELEPSHRENTEMKVDVSQPVVRMNPSARLLQSAVRDAVGPVSTGPASKKIRSLASTILETGKERQNHANSTVTKEEPTGLPSTTVWGRTGESSSAVQKHDDAVLESDGLDSKIVESKSGGDKPPAEPQPNNILDIDGQNSDLSQGMGAQRRLAGRLGSLKNDVADISDTVVESHLLPRETGRTGRLLPRDINTVKVEAENAERGARLAGRLGPTTSSIVDNDFGQQLTGRGSMPIGGEVENDIYTNDGVEFGYPGIGRGTRLTGRLRQIGGGGYDVEPQSMGRTSRLTGRLGPVYHDSVNGIEAGPQGLGRDTTWSARPGPYLNRELENGVEAQRIGGQSRLSGRLGFVNGYPDNVVRDMTGVASLGMFPDDVPLSRDEFLEQSELHSTLYGEEGIHVEGWSGDSVMHYGHPIDAQMAEGYIDEIPTNRLGVWEGQGFRVDLPAPLPRYPPPPMATVKERLGPNILSVSSSSWHRNPTEQKDHVAPGESLRAVMEETETDDEAMDDQSGHQEQESNEAVPQEDVEAMKRRMRQVELEMVKLKARQSLKATPPATGIAVSGPVSKEEINARSIFVSNVHFAATVPGLTAHFKTCGEILRVTLLSDPVSGGPKGCAYVEFSSTDAVEKALTLNESSYLSRMLKVVPKPAEPTVASSLPRGKIRRPGGPLRGVGRASSSTWTPAHSFPPVSVGRGAPSFTKLQWKRSDNAATESPSGAGGEKGLNLNALEFPSPVIKNGTVNPGTAGGGGSSALFKSSSLPNRGINRCPSYHRPQEVSSDATSVKVQAQGMDVQTGNPAEREPQTAEAGEGETGNRD